MNPDDMQRDDKVKIPEIPGPEDAHYLSKMHHMAQERRYEEDHREITGHSLFPSGSMSGSGYHSKGKAHPGFRAVQSSIARKEGISKERAGAILAASSRAASKGAHRKNPRLNRVKD